MATYQLNLEIEEGTDYNLQITYTEPSTGLPIDLTGYTAAIYVDRNISDTGTLVTLSTTNGLISITSVDGVITVTIPGSTTMGFGQFIGFYNLYITSPTNELIKLAKGFFTVMAGVLP